MPRNIGGRMKHVRTYGFTLIELMVTVAVVAILAAVAMPSYNDYVIRGKIPQATSNLSTLRAQMEQYYLDNQTYIGACTSGTTAPLPTSDDFQYSCPTLTASTYTARAQGVSGGPMSGFTYTIDQSNARTTTALPSGWGTAPVSCWVTKRGGVC